MISSISAPRRTTSTIWASTRRAAAGTPLTPIGAAPMSIKSFTQLITVGLNYRFNWSGGGAVVTR